MHIIKDQELLKTGRIIKHFPMEICVREYIKNKDYVALDKWIKTQVSQNGSLYNELLKYAHFNSIEHIIAKRDAKTDEEGIWHCDGSRNLAFTWSLNLRPESIQGGELFFRKKGSKEMDIFSPPIFETLIIFCTGMNGFEHRVGKVINGERLTFAGWCSLQI